MQKTANDAETLEFLKVYIKYHRTLNYSPAKSLLDLYENTAAPSRILAKTSELIRQNRKKTKAFYVT